MTTWQQFAEQAPDLAASARAQFTAQQHHVLATLRADGSPRVSGTEVSWYGPDLTIGSMPGARKALDLRRDARFALHANPGDGALGEPNADVKITGRAREVTGDEQRAWFEAVQPPDADSHLFRLLLTEVVTTGVSADETHLVIRHWTAEHGERTFRRH